MGTSFKLSSSRCIYYCRTISSPFFLKNNTQVDSNYYHHHYFHPIHHFYNYIQSLTTQMIKLCVYRWIPFYGLIKICDCRMEKVFYSKMHDSACYSLIFILHAQGIIHSSGTFVLCLNIFKYYCIGATKM